MNRLSDWLLSKLIGLLPPKEREAVAGDIREMNFGALQSFQEVAGLILRHEFQARYDYSVWLGSAALFVLVLLPVRYLLSWVVGLPMIYARTYSKYGVRYYTGLSFPQDATIWVIQTVAMLFFAWSAGIVAARLFRGALLPAYLRLLIAWAAWLLIMSLTLVGRGVPILIVVPMLLLRSAPLVAPALVGTSRRITLSGRRSMSLVALSLTLVALLTWTSGWWQRAITEMHGGFTPELVTWHLRSWPWLLASWPAFYLVIETSREKASTSKRKCSWPQSASLP